MARRRHGSYDSYGWGGYAPYVPVHKRRRQAEKRVAALAKKGHVVSPVRIEGRAIATTFWGRAWCENLEDYSDFENRLPRGRTYVRNGSVIDLKIEAGRVVALVSGSSIYKVEVAIQPVPRGVWEAIRGECAGKIDSLVELLQGRLSGGVMAVMTRQRGGLFPTPREIRMGCSCPDWATLCKHVAAVLYGIGARLDERPELLFTLREVDHLDLVGGAGAAAAVLDRPAAAEEKVLAGADLSEIFGIDLDGGGAAVAPEAAPARAKAPVRAGRGRTTKVAKAARTTKVAKAARTTKVAKAATVTARDLMARGVPRPTIGTWLRSGVLRRTPERGVYRTTPETEGRIEACLARRRA